MIRISISYFYGVGTAVHPLASVKAGQALLDVWLACNRAEQSLTGLFSSEWFFPAIKTTYGAGQKLLKVLQKTTQRDDFDAEITHPEAFEITSALTEFETVWNNELSIADAYFVTRKAAYDTYALIANAETMFPPELLQKCPHAVADIREAGKCLAFELTTASGFHVLRATEAVLRRYWEVVSKDKPHPKQKNLGVYIKKMQEAHIGNAKVVGVLTQIKDLHRNPLMHPEETLNLQEAISLFGICQSAISAMLNDIPMPPPPALIHGATAS